MTHVLAGERTQRWIILTLAVLTACCVAVWLASPVLQPRILGGDASIRLWRPAALATVFLLFGIWVVRYRPRLLHDYFGARRSAVNLAVFRIVLFALLVTSENIWQAIRYSQVPDVLQYPPLGLGGIVAVLPINEPVVVMAAGLFVVAGTCALVGLYTRPAAIVTTLLGLYVLGIPQFYGKVNHYHHLLWFAAILAVSRCGDAVSVDAMRRAWRVADRGQIFERPSPALAYALPLRFVWLLMGLIYFFPGFWKFVVSGPAWALSDNVRDMLYAKWLDFGGWQAPFAIDSYPMLYRAAGLGTLAFELLFIVLILFPRTRPVAAVTGFFFHTTTFLFMRINFLTLQMLYVSFINWDGLARRVGRRWQPVRLEVRYDPASLGQRRAAGLVMAADVCSIATVSRRAGGQLEVLDRGRRLRGHDAVKVLTGRIPLLWPLRPALVIPIVRRAFVDGVDELAIGPAGKVPSKPAAWQSVAVVGTVLMALNGVAGLARVLDGWPFAVYPLFASIAPSQVSTVSVELTTEQGKRIMLQPADLDTGLPPERLTGLVAKLLAEEDEQVRQGGLLALLGSGRAEVDLRAVRTVTFYEDILATAPHLISSNPVRRDRMVSVRLNDAPSALRRAIVQ